VNVCERIRISLVEPKPYTVIKDQVIRFKAIGNNKGIKEVIFYAEVTSEEGTNKRKIKIGNLNQPPYEIVWGVKDIPDQSFWSMVIWIELMGHDGTIHNLNGELEKTEFLVLDRINPSPNKEVQCFYTKRKKIIDGYDKLI